MQSKPRRRGAATGAAPPSPSSYSSSLLEPLLAFYTTSLIPRYPVFDVDNNMVRASFNVTVTARNPNKKIGIYYEEGSHLGLWYTDSSLCKGSFPEFYQGRRNMTVLNIIMTGESQLTGELLTELQQQQQQTGMIPLLFKGDVMCR